MAWRSRFRRRSIENAQADEKFNELMRKERQKGATKPCPKCKQAITKNHGCDHMTFRQCGKPSRERHGHGLILHRCPCGYEFYWSTGKPYGKFAAGGGGFFGGWMGGGAADY